MRMGCRARVGVSHARKNSACGARMRFQRRSTNPPMPPPPGDVRGRSRRQPSARMDNVVRGVALGPERRSWYRRRKALWNPQTISWADGSVATTGITDSGLSSSIPGSVARDRERRRELRCHARARPAVASARVHRPARRHGRVRAPVVETHAARRTLNLAGVRNTPTRALQPILIDQHSSMAMLFQPPVREVL